MRFALPIFALLAAGPAFAKGPDFSTPAETAKSYLAATRANDVAAARRCWAVDDDNVSGALDVIVGMWIASRRLSIAADARFGPDGVKALGRWHRVHGTNEALDTTLQRLGNVKIQERGEVAKMTIDWQPGDGDTTPAFLCVRAPLFFRLVGGEWKLDANVFTGAEKAADLFGPGKIGAVWRDEMAVMTDLATRLEKGEWTALPSFEAELKRRVEALKAKYEK
jgi:hypothetical protein